MALGRSRAVHISVISLVALPLIAFFSACTLLSASALFWDAVGAYPGTAAAKALVPGGSEVDLYRFNGTARLADGTQHILWGLLGAPVTELVLSALGLVGSIELYKRRSVYPRLLLAYSVAAIVIGLLDAMSYGYLAAHTDEVLSTIAIRAAHGGPPSHGVIYLWTQSRVLELAFRYGPGVCVLVWFAVHRAVYKEHGA